MPPFASFVNGLSHSEHSRESVDKASVRFSLDKNEVQPIPTLGELSEQEISDMYYTSGDFKKMRSKNKVILRLMKTGRFNGDSDEYCFRGVVIESLKQERQARLQKVYGALFWEVKRQSVEGVQNPSSIARKVAEITRQSTEEALVRACEDAAAVQDEKQLAYYIPRSSTSVSMTLKPAMRRVAV